MREANFEATQLHGPRQAGDEGAVVVDEDEGAVLGEFVGLECQIVFGHGCLQIRRTIAGSGPDPSARALFI
jgi:hypothetical protein